MAIQKILVPTDFSETAKGALVRAAEIARAFGAELRLLHVVDLPHDIDDQLLVADPDTKDKLMEMKKTAFDEADAKMTAFVQSAAIGDAAARRYYLEGDVTKGILQSIDEQGIDMVVIGARSRTNLERLLLGSVPYRVAHGGHCPVLFVPEGCCG